MTDPEARLSPEPIEDAPAATPEGHAPAPRGEPSPQLRQALGYDQGGVLDTSPEYERATDAVPERGIFRLVGGYLDDDGVVHNEVELRAISGREEELLGLRSAPILERLNTILTDCTKRFGTITDPNQIRQAIARLPGGSRIHHLICLRRTTHWRKTKDMYDMAVECPKCGLEQIYTLDLGRLDLYEMEDPTRRVFSVELPDSGKKVEWRVATSQQEYVLGLVSDAADHEYLNFMIMARLVTVDEEDARLTSQNLLTDDGKQLRLDAKAKKVREMVRGWSSGDRDQMREEFLRHEPGVDVDLQFKCTAPKCRKPFNAKLDVAQESFFFPSATFKRSKRRSSTGSSRDSNTM